jgi:hypothetical protein
MVRCSQFERVFGNNSKGIEFYGKSHIFCGTKVLEKMIYFKLSIELQ